MDLGEFIAEAAVDNEGTCWFCKEQPTSKFPKNEEDADPDTSDSEDEDSVPENNHENNASQLGRKIGNSPNWEIRHPNNPKEKTKIVPGAHHCIPGNASFKKATDLHDFMKKGGPFNLISDIGYNINAKENGVWLPGNYGVREGKENYKKKWSKMYTYFKNFYANRAMMKAGAQFHDAHTKYNNKVLKTLESIASKLGEPTTRCPICNDKYNNTRPPYGLVSRLNFVSGAHRTLLAPLTDNRRKTVEGGYCTSSRVKNFFGTNFWSYLRKK